MYNNRFAKFIYLCKITSNKNYINLNYIFTKLISKLVRWTKTNSLSYCKNISKNPVLYIHYTAFEGLQKRNVYNFFLLVNTIIK